MRNALVRGIFRQRWLGRLHVLRMFFCLGCVLGGGGSRIRTCLDVASAVLVLMPRQSCVFPLH